MSEEVKKEEGGVAEVKTGEEEKPLEEQLKVAQERIKILESQTENAGQLRKSKEESEKKHFEEKKTLASQVEALQKQITDRDERRSVEWFDDELEKFTTNDEEKKKVREEYSLLNLPNGTKEEVRIRTAKALKLAGIELKGDTFAYIGPSGGSREGKSAETEEQKKRKESVDNMLFPNLVKKS